MLHIDIAVVGKKPGQVAQYFLNHRLKLRPQRPQPLPTLLMKEIFFFTLDNAHSGIADVTARNPYYLAT